MYKFTIVLQGRGSEIYQHPIDSDQKEQLEHLNLQECILEDVADILNVDMEQLVSTEKSIVGGIPENTEIVVFDDENATVFKEEVQQILFQETHDPNSDMFETYNSNTLYVEDNVKGQFFQIEVEDDKNFDISKLKINITDIEGKDYITSIEYKGIEGSFGDYWSKGIHFFLSNE